MKDKARICRAALQDVQRARLDADQRQSFSVDFDLSDLWLFCVVLVRQCDLEIP